MEPVPAGLVPVLTPPSLGTRIGRHCDCWAAGSQHPAASSPGYPSARPTLPGPPGWLRLGADGISVPFPPLSAGASFPSQCAFFFLVYQALGKAGASQAPSRAPLGGRQLGADVLVSGAGGSTLPSLHLTPATLAWQSAPLSAEGGHQSLLSEARSHGVLRALRAH